MRAGRMGAATRGSTGLHSLSLLLFGLAAAGLGGCEYRATTVEPEAPESSHEIPDAAHGSEFSHFYFLPPLVPEPTTDGVFDGSLSPRVEICESDLTGCVEAPLAVFTTESGPGGETVRVSESDEHYVVNWHTSDFSLESDRYYRIRVLVLEVLLGFADVDMVDTGGELRSVRTGEFIALKDDRTLPIKFRIEAGAVFVIGAEGGIVSSDDETTTLEIPEGALEEDVAITVEGVPEVPEAPDFVEGTAFDFGPDGLQFIEPATMIIRYDLTKLAPGTAEDRLRIHKLVDGRWRVLRGGTVDLVQKEVVASVQGFSTFSVSESPAPPDRNYLTAGNTQLIGGPYVEPSSPHVTDSEGLLDGTSGLTVTSTGALESRRGGTVTMEADGGFSYLPPSGLMAPDTFYYHVDSGDSASVEIRFQERVWYVSNAGASGDGTSVFPFPTMSEAETAASAGDHLHVASGDGSTTGYDTGIVLADGQQLLGEGVPLEIVPFGTLHPAGPSPRLTGDTIVTLGNENRVAGLTLENAGTLALSGSGIGGAAIEDVTVSGGAMGIWLDEVTDTVSLTALQVETSGYALFAEAGDPSVSLELIVSGGSYIGPDADAFGVGAWGSASIGVTMAGVRVENTSTGGMLRFYAWDDARLHFDVADSHMVTASLGSPFTLSTGGANPTAAGRLSRNVFDGGKSQFSVTGDVVVAADSNQSNGTIDVDLQRAASGSVIDLTLDGNEIAVNHELGIGFGPEMGISVFHDLSQPFSFCADITNNIIEVADDDEGIFMHWDHGLDFKLAGLTGEPDDYLRAQNQFVLSESAVDVRLLNAGGDPITSTSSCRAP